MKKIPQDIVGNIAVLKFSRRTPYLIRKYLAWRFLRSHKGVRTVLEKVSGFSGELRVQKLRHLAGKKTTIARYKESGCVFEVDLSKAYFSPRLSNERIEISRDILSMAKNKAKVLFMFAGVFPYPIVLAKMALKEKKNLDIYANELNEDAIEYAKKNMGLNKVSGKIKIIPGDARKISRKKFGAFDFIVMTRPNIPDTFLDSALRLSKRGTRIYYHGFGTAESVLDEVKSVVGKKGKNFEAKIAGDIGVKKFRVRVSFDVA